jgi:hypothetical protein
MSSASVLAGIAWDPQIRGFLAVLVGVVVLLGSIYLLLLTNLGTRLGFMIAAAAFWGWLFLMGSVWWIYGNVGMLGEEPHWEVKEVLYPGTGASGYEDVRALDSSGLPSPDDLAEAEEADLQEARDDFEPDLAGWKLLPESNPAFGEAKAAVDEHFVAEPDEELDIDAAEDYVALYSFERGGKERLSDNPDPSRLDRIWNKLKTTFWQLRHPPRYAVIQVQRVVEQQAEPGKPPPTPTADESSPVITVVMERNLGDKRFPGAMLTISSGIMFWIFCATLHRRDQRVAEVRGLLPAGGEA